MLLQNVEKLAQLYASPDDVEVTVGGSLEEHISGTLTGPTFLCIFVEQFYRTRVGDRYWFERGDHELAFTIGKYPIFQNLILILINFDNLTFAQPFRFFTRQFYFSVSSFLIFFLNNNCYLIIQSYNFAEQLNEIRKTSIARLFCDNGDNIQRMQQRGFEKVSQL